MKTGVLVLCAVFIAGGMVSCKTPPPVDELTRANQTFLDQSGDEVFRVVMMSDRYLVRQKQHESRFSRAHDSGGDQYFMERMKRIDLIDVAREGIIRVRVYPDTGRLMQVRFLESTYIEDIDKLIVDDIQRWTFNYERGVYPHDFKIRYRVVLQKRR